MSDISGSPSPAVKGKGGRPKNEIVWCHFIQLSYNSKSKHWKAKCKYCDFIWLDARVNEVREAVCVACILADTLCLYC